MQNKTRAIEGAVLIALALSAPALGLAQEAGSTAGASTPSATTPATSAPAAGAPAAAVPSGALPGAVVPISGLTGVGATGLAPMPSEYTRYGVSAGVGESDNVNYSRTHPKSQTLTAANLFFDLIRTGSRLQLNAVGNFSDTDYLQGAYSNQVLGRFDGMANFTLWKRHLTWLVRDDYGDSQINVLQSLTPLNLQRMNIFSTGPSLMLQPTLSSFVELQGLYSRNTWQDSPFSGNTESGSVTIGHAFSPAARISLVGQIEQQRFDNTTFNPDYQVREYYGRYSLKAARTSLDVQGGLAQANDTGSWTTSPLVRLSITRNLSPFSSVSLAAGRDYTNAMGSFASLASGVTGSIPVGGATQTTENAVRSFGNVSWGFHRLRTTINVLAGWERDAYDVQSRFNVTRTDLSLNLGRHLTPRLSASILATADRSKYDGQGFTDTYGTVGGGLIYRPGRWVVLYGRYDHQFRNTSGATQGFGYGENRIYVMIGYYPHSAGTGAPGQGGMGMGGIM